jgi:hypothetical protein
MGWPHGLTHRQFLTWEAWLAEERDAPSRADTYVMQLTAEVLKLPGRVWGAKWESEPGWKSFWIPLNERHSAANDEGAEHAPEELPEGFPKRVTKANMLEMSKHVWMARMQLMGVKVVRRGN